MNLEINTLITIKILNMKIYMYPVKIFFLHLILVFSPILTNAQPYTMKNAPIGGGGFVSGIITHQTSGDIYCRTDVGGAYRWDVATSKWVQLLDWVSEEERNFFAVESMAIDPQNADNVYMLSGLDYLDFGKTAILKSTDKGKTFTAVDVTSQFKAHGNGIGRSTGERLAVDPNNSNLLFCGTRRDGLWKSTNGGSTWSPAWDGVTTTPNDNGICFVVFDPASSVVSGATQTIYIGVSRLGSTNVYRSTDGGTTFTALSATLPTTFMPQRAALSGGMLYITYANGSGPHGHWDSDLNEPVNDGQVWVFNTSTSIATDITPVTGKAYSGVSVDPANVNRVIVSTTNSWDNNQFGNAWGDYVYLSTNGGSTWTQKLSNTSTLNTNGIGWISGSSIHWAGSIEFTPGNTAEVRVVSGNGIYTCSDISAENPSWKFDVKGIEETAFLDGISIPGGPFISSFGDVCGFVHDPLTSFPSARLSPTDKNNQSIAYAAGNTNKVVRASDEGSVIYYSTDKGATWTASATNKGPEGKVTISADGGTILHCPWGSTTTWYTTNNGGSWSSCLGVSVRDAAPVADQVNSNYFYIFHPSTGQMYRSSDKGVSFSVAGTPGSSTVNHPWEPVLIRTVSGFEGHVWVPLGGNGLKYSTDHGATYTNLSDVTYCKSIGVGKKMSEASYPTIFIWGTVSGVKGLFRSTDQGATWLRMNDDAHEFGGAPLLVGDMNIEGRLYMSTGGARGIIYWDDESVPVPDDESPTSAGFDKYSENPFPKAWPNPASGEFNVEIKKNKEEVLLTISNMLGQVVEEINVPAGVSEITIGKHLVPGIYHLTIWGSSGKETIRLLKN